MHSSIKKYDLGLETKNFETQIQKNNSQKNIQ